MRIGLFKSGWWNAACEKLGHGVVLFDNPQHPSGNPHQSDLPSRSETGTAVAAQLANQPVDMLLDNSGTGLGFVRDTAADDLKLTHEKCSLPLVSHFIDPLVTTFHGLGWQTAWQCLQSNTWIKTVWDRAQAAELQQFGVPHVGHLPMAAPDRDYDTSPRDPKTTRPFVSFVGAQNTSYFSPHNVAQANTLWHGVLAHAVQAGLPQMSFFDIYFDLYGLDTLPTPADDDATRLQKTQNYFDAKLFFNASLCVRNRDRIVIFLKKKLGDVFELIGDRWDTTYGLATQPRIPTVEGYLRHFRDTAINLNLVNGNAESGLNMRHFEITAAGGFMLCKAHPELEDCFEIGRECAVFNNEADLLDQIKHYLARPEERAEIALAGQRRTLKDHLFSHRLTTLLDGMRISRYDVEFSQAHWIDDLRRFVPSADVVLDCGANVGQKARVLRDVYPNANIYSFEPVESAAVELRKLCRELNVNHVAKAVGDFDGSATMHLTAGSEAHSLLEFQPGNPCAKWTQVVGAQEVPVCKIDTWCADERLDPKRVDVIKLDVQGAELAALLGARKTLETTRVVYAEVGFVALYRDMPLLADIDALMQEMGFRREAVYPSDQPQNWGDALYVNNRFFPANEMAESSSATTTAAAKGNLVSGAPRNLEVPDRAAKDHSQSEPVTATATEER